jgi:hypothetical protein
VETVVRFYRHLDDRAYDKLVALLDEAGEWHRQGTALHGRVAVLNALSQRPATLRIHHLLTNLASEPAGGGELSVIAYMSVVRHDAGRPLAGAAPLDGIENLRTIRARLRATPAGWRITHLAHDDISFDRQA